MITAERLTAIKQYCRIDYDEDDAQLTGVAEMGVSYLTQCGITRDGHEALYALIVPTMVLNQYEGKCADNAAAALATVPPLVRQLVNQLKLVCAFGGAGDGDTGA